MKEAVSASSHLNLPALPIRFPIRTGGPMVPGEFNEA